MNLKHSEVSEMVFSDFVEQLIIYSKIICGMVKPWCLVLLVIDPIGIQTKKNGNNHPRWKWTEVTPAGFLVPNSLSSHEIHIGSDLGEFFQKQIF
jgi:hypothetical protein